MIKPTQQDIGRDVVYTGGFGEPEDGVITSFNALFVGKLKTLILKAGDLQHGLIAKQTC